MVILLESVNSSGTPRRCDEKCYNAHHPICNCCCGGANHGVGLSKAQANLKAWVENLQIPEGCLLPGMGIQPSFF